VAHTRWRKKQLGVHKTLSTKNHRVFNPALPAADTRMESFEGFSYKAAGPITTNRPRDFIPPKVSKKWKTKLWALPML
jgi:hypothetical protein